MRKCDFCTKMKPDGQCWWTTQLAAEDDCKKAINKMTEALKSLSQSHIKRKKLF